MYKIISEFPKYRIHSTGLIESCYKFKTNIPTNTWREVKQIYDKSCGYMLVTLCENGTRKNKRVHRLLMEAFKTNPNNYPHINHIDGNKLNNDLNNLEWCSPKHNASHAAKMGFYQPQIDKTSIPINQYDLKGNLLSTFTSLHEAGRQTNTMWQNIWKVCNKRRNTAGNFYWEYA